MHHIFPLPLGQAIYFLSPYFMAINSFSNLSQSQGILVQSYTGHQGSRRLRLLEFLDNRHMKVETISALRTGRLYPFPPGDNPNTHFCQRLSRPQDHRSAGRITSMKNSTDPEFSGLQRSAPTNCATVCNPPSIFYLLLFKIKSAGRKLPSRGRHISFEYGTSHVAGASSEVQSGALAPVWDTQRM